MKKLIGWNILLFTLASASVAFAGANSSGGGPSVLCRGPDGKIQTAQLLDLYEGQIRYQLNVPHSSAPVEQQLAGAIQRLGSLNPYLAMDTAAALKVVQSKITYLPPGVIMAPGVDLGDSYAALIPDGCELAYVGYYEADGTLRISQDIFSHFDETNRAALFLHEALYKVARTEAQQKNSLNTREVNAYLLSSAADLSPIADTAGSLTWLGYFQAMADAREPGSIHSVYQPARVPELQDVAVVTLTGPQGIFQGANLSVTCYGQDGKARTVFERMLDDQMGTQQTVSVPAKGCAELVFYTLTGGVNFPMQLAVKYGEQTIFTGATAQVNKELHPGSYEFNLDAWVPIYAGGALGK